MNRREFLKKSLEGIVLSCIPLISSCTRNPVSSDYDLESRTKIAFSSNRDGKYNIYTINPDGSDLKQLTYEGKYNMVPVWSPDGKKITFSSDRDGNAKIYVMNVDGINQTRLTNKDDDIVEGYAAWSPDGKKIVFSAGQPFNPSSQYGRSDLYILNLPESTVRQFTNGPYSGKWPGLDTDSSPSWSPDGDKIVYVSSKPNGGIMVKSVIDDNPAYSVLQWTYIHDIAWSPDGGYFVFSKTGSSVDIYLLPVDRQTGMPTGEPIWLTNGLSSSWSPDGKKIIFAGTGEPRMSSDGTDNEIYIINLDGSNRIKLTNNDYNDIHPTWSPYLK